jgi:hypothetical protein
VIRDDIKILTQETGVSCYVYFFELRIVLSQLMMWWFQHHITCKNLYHPYLNRLHILTFGQFLGGGEWGFIYKFFYEIYNFYDLSHKLLRVDEKDADDEIHSTYLCKLLC